MEVPVSKKSEFILHRSRIYKALSQCASEIIYLTQVLKDFGIDMKTTTVYEDN